MANKKSLAIELKDMNNYPDLEERKEEIKSRPIERPQAVPGNTNPPHFTPIVPISSQPPPLSFVEQQRLSMQHPMPDNRIQYPNLPQQPQRMSMPIMNNGFLSITCSGCRGVIQYPANVPIVHCLHCKVSTATKPLLNIQCHFCKASSYYMADSPQIRCRCGTVYSIRPA